MSNYTPQQIEEFLQEFFDVVGTRQYIGARYVPVFGRPGEQTIEWDGGTAPYEPLTIVLYQGNSFTSRTYVPIGVPITDTDYWANTGNYNAQVEAYREEVLRLEDDWDDWREETEAEIAALSKQVFGLNGKSICVFGDSTSVYNLNRDGTVGKSTPQMIADITGAQMHVYGVGGATICPASTSSASSDQIKSIYWQVFERNDLANYDLFLIFGLTNDIQGGNDVVSRGNYPVTDASAAAMTIINRIRNANPSAPIVWVGPYAMYRGTSGRAFTPVAAINAFARMLDSLGVPFVDMYHDNGVSMSNISANMEGTIYVHPYERLRMRSAYKATLALCSGEGDGYRQQGQAVTTLLSSPDRVLMASAVDTGFGRKNLGAYEYSKIKFTIPADTNIRLASPLYSNTNRVAFTFVGYAVTDTTKIYLQVKLPAATDWTDVAYINGAYAGANKNFAFTVDANVLAAAGIDLNTDAYLDVRIHAAAESQICGGILINGYYTGDRVTFAIAEDQTDGVYYFGEHIIVNKQLNNATFDSTAHMTNIPSWLQAIMAISQPTRIPVIAWSSAGVTTSAVLQIGTDAITLKDVSNTLMADWSGILYVTAMFTHPYVA